MLSEYVNVLVTAIVGGFTSLFPVYSSKLADTLGSFCPMCTYAGVLLAILYSFRYSVGDVAPSVLRKRIRDEQRFFFYVAVFTIVIALPVLKGGRTRASPYALLLLGVLIMLFSWRPPLRRAAESMRNKNSPTPLDGILTGISQGLAFFGIPVVALTYVALRLTGLERKKALRLMLMSLSVYFAIAMLVSPAPCFHSGLLKATYLIGAFFGALIAVRVLIKVSGSKWFPLFYGGLALLSGLLAIVG